MRAGLLGARCSGQRGSLNRRALVRVRRLGWSRNTSTAWVRSRARCWCWPGPASRTLTTSLARVCLQWCWNWFWKVSEASSNVGVLAERFVGQSVHITSCLDYSPSHRGLSWGRKLDQVSHGCRYWNRWRHHWDERWCRLNIDIWSQLSASLKQNFSDTITTSSHPTVLQLISKKFC